MDGAGGTAARRLLLFPGEHAVHRHRKGTPMTQDHAISPFVRRLVGLMESKYRVPGTGIRFGFDAVIGLVPGFGDFAGMLIGLAVVVEAIRLRVRLSVVLRMLANLWLDGVLGSVPVLGDLFDLYFRANARNLRLLEAEI